MSLKTWSILGICALATACAHLSTDKLPQGAPRGQVAFSLRVGNATNVYKSYVFHIAILQDVDGKVVPLGQLRTGGIEVGDYKRITATARPGVARFFVKADTLSGLKSGAFPFDVNVVENAVTEVTILLSDIRGGYEVDFVNARRATP